MEELIAEDGYVYALKSDNTIYGKRITLGITDNPDNWIKIDEPLIDINCDEKES